MKKQLLLIIIVLFVCIPMAVHAAKDELNVAIIDVAHLDPQGALNEFVIGVVTFNIMEDLYNIDKEGNIVPQLALSHSTVDGKTWDFKLRPGVRYHDGTRLNAEAVKYTFDRYQTRRYKGMLRNLDRTEVIDDLTVRFVLKRSDATFIRQIAAAQMFHMMSPAQKGLSDSEVGMNPIGTGAFKFVEWKKGSHITVERNDDWWGPTPPLRKITFKIIPEKASQTLALRAGDVDLVLRPSESDAAKLAKDPDFKVGAFNGFSLYALHLNTMWGPLKDKRVRQALNYAVDKKAIIAAVMRGFGEESCGFFPKGLFGYKAANCYSYNPAKAKQLLREAGYPNGFEMNLYNSAIYNSKVPTAIQAYWRAIGVKAEVVTLEQAAYVNSHKLAYDKTKKRSNISFFPIFTIESPVYVQLYLGKFGWPPKMMYNTMFYENQEVEAIMAQLTQIIDEEERRQKYMDLLDIVSEDAPFVTLFSVPKITIMKKNVEGFWIDLRAGYHFESTWVN